jgi:hypothetical protein
MRQIPNHPDRDHIGELPLDKMRVKVAREVTKAAYQHSHKNEMQETIKADAEA